MIDNRQILSDLNFSQDLIDFVENSPDYKGFDFQETEVFSYVEQETIVTNSSYVYNSNTQYSQKQ